MPSPSRNDWDGFRLDGGGLELAQGRRLEQRQSVAVNVLDGRGLGPRPPSAAKLDAQLPPSSGEASRGDALLQPGLDASGVGSCQKQRYDRCGQGRSGDSGSHEWNGARCGCPGAVADRHWDGALYGFFMAYVRRKQDTSRLRGRREEASPVLVQTEFPFALELDGGPELDEEEAEEAADREAAAKKTGSNFA